MERAKCGQRGIDVTGLEDGRQKASARVPGAGLVDAESSGAESQQGSGRCPLQAAHRESGDGAAERVLASFGPGLWLDGEGGSWGSAGPETLS